jgi:hypothetical protein
MESAEEPLSGDASRYREQAAFARKMAAAAWPGSRVEGDWLDIADSYEDLAHIEGMKSKQRYLMTDVTNALARSLIAIHGTGALEIAERAAENVRQLHLAQAQLDEWHRVIAAIKTLQNHS